MAGKTFKDLMMDAEFTKKMVSQPTMEDAKKLFEDEGVSMTDEEMETLRVVLEKALTKGELSDEDLKEIVGAGTAAKVIGGLIGATVGFFAGGLTGLSVGTAISGKDVEVLGGIEPENVKNGAEFRVRGKMATSTMVGMTAGVVGGAVGGAALANWIVGDSKKKKHR